MFWAVYVSTLSIPRVHATGRISILESDSVPEDIDEAKSRHVPLSIPAIQIIAENHPGVMGANTRKVVVGKLFRNFCSVLLPQRVWPKPVLRPPTHRAILHHHPRWDKTRSSCHTSSLLTHPYIPPATPHLTRDRLTSPPFFLSPASPHTPPTI